MGTKLIATGLALLSAYFSVGVIHTVYLGVFSWHGRIYYEAAEPFPFWLCIGSEAVGIGVSIFMAFLFFNAVETRKK